MVNEIFNKHPITGFQQGDNSVQRSILHHRYPHTFARQYMEKRRVRGFVAGNRPEMTGSIFRAGHRYPYNILECAQIDSTFLVCLQRYLHSLFKIAVLESQLDCPAFTRFTIAPQKFRYIPVSCATEKNIANFFGFLYLVYFNVGSY